MIAFTIENIIHNYNGYVVVDKTYSIYGEEYDRLPLDVHGGLTFGCSLKECKKDFQRIYEKYLSIDGTSEEDDVWIYGFDTVHLGDEPYERDEVRVSVEIHNLIEQIEKYKIIKMERNLLLETISVLTENGKTWDSIVWIGSEDGFIELEEAKKLFDTEYDSGYGAAHVPTDLMIVGDNRWMTRGEYDGSEWRDFHTSPQKPSNTLKVKSLVGGMRDKLKDF